MNYIFTLDSSFFTRSFRIFNLRIFWTILILLTISLLIFYIFQVGLLTREIYLIEEYEGKINNLAKENKNLEINLSKSNSLANIGNYLSRENFVKANQVKYIRILESSAMAK